MLALMTLLLCGALLAKAVVASPPFTDYCHMLGQDDIQGKKSGFLTGNKLYYVGGTFLVQHLAENETIGLTHPFFHDLRSRGTGIATYDGVGTGNDFDAWEFYRATKVLYGTVVADGMRWETPAPARMFWRPDKMITEYELTNPFLQGQFDGWCQNWREGSTNGTGLGKSFWVNVTQKECWDHCNVDRMCEQAVFETNTGRTSQCWLGLNHMTAGATPTGNRGGCNAPNCQDHCFARGKAVPQVNIKEEKFISANDVVSAIITADRPVTLEFSGHSFSNDNGAAGDIVSLSGRCSIDVHTNSIRVLEGGVVNAKVAQDPVVKKLGKLMYDGMSGVISASRDMRNVTLSNLSNGVCGYTFQVPVDSRGTTVSWTMNDDYSTALAAVLHVLSNSSKHLIAKTAAVNDLLNNVVPYFRCSDQDIVKVYYFLWSIYLNYFTQGDQGMQVLSHTQTAVNNFLGMHRYDAMFQILVGSWTSPAVHEFYANGNVLSWSYLLPYRKHDMVPDNFGIDWASGCYGSEAIAHVIGAYQVYAHSGNKTFLKKAYDFYKELFWDGISGKVFGYAYDSVLCLNKMAEALGHPEDVAHWNASVDMAGVDRMLASQWEIDTPHWYGSTTAGMSWGNFAAAGMSMFPRNWTVAMAENWLDDPVNGFFGEIPLTCTARKDWPQHVDPSSAAYNFMVTPDANWFMLRALYLQNVNKLANKFTLAHLKKYNMEWGIPVAPETRRMNFALHGDQYSNFNAGKILLILEGIGGLRYSTHEDSFIFADNLPTNWTYMEVQVPVQKPGSDVTWVKTRAERKCQGGDHILKTVTVEGNPFKSLFVQPWAEDGNITSSSPGGAQLNPPAGHVGWMFNAESATVSLTLEGSTSCTPSAPAMPGAVATETYI